MHETPGDLPDLVLVLFGREPRIQLLLGRSTGEVREPGRPVEVAALSTSLRRCPSAGEGLQRILGGARTATATELVESIRDGALGFSAGSIRDDIAIVAIRVPTT